MKLQKENDSLGIRNLAKVMDKADCDGKGVMDFEEFEEALKKYNVFLPVKEIQAIMKCHNRGDDRNYLVDYAAWVNSLKLPLKGRRLGIVQEALAKVNPSGADSITVA